MREIVDLRMQLVPYLYSAFAKYHFQGLPPIRSLLFDFPGDKKLWSLDSEFMFGDNLLVRRLCGQAIPERFICRQGQIGLNLKQIKNLPAALNMM